MGELAKVADFYKALGDETRLGILQLLAEQEMCVCEIIDKLGMNQSAVSHHLKILKHAGLVLDERDGKWIYYSLNPEVFFQLNLEDSHDLILSYAEPLRQSLWRSKSSQIRTDATLCQTLTAKQGQSGNPK